MARFKRLLRTLDVKKFLLSSLFVAGAVLGGVFLISDSPTPPFDASVELGISTQSKFDKTGARAIPASCEGGEGQCRHAICTSITATPGTVLAGQPVELEWTTINAGSVKIDNDVGTQPANGSVTVHPQNSTIYHLAAFSIDGGPAGFCGVEVTVSGSPPPPEAEIKCNGRLYNCVIGEGKTANISWSGTRGAVACALSATENGTTKEPWVQNPGLSGSKTTAALTYPGGGAYSLVCQNAVGVQAFANVLVNVRKAPVCSIKANGVSGHLKVDYNTSARVTWNQDGNSNLSADAGDSCILTTIPGQSYPNQPVSGSVDTGPLTSDIRYEIGCTQANTGAACNAAINLQALPPPIMGHCAPSSQSVAVGQQVTWGFNSGPTGGNGTYTYQWGGSDGLSGTGPTVTQRYSRIGTSTAFANVTSGGITKRFDCNPAVTVTQQAQPLSAASCTATPSPASPGQAVTWTVTPSGGIPPYTYSWSGTDNLTGSTQSVDKAYSTGGTKNASVVIRNADGSGSSITKNCSVNVENPTPMCSFTGPSSMVQGSLQTLSWNGVNATQLTPLTRNGTSLGNRPIPGSGSLSSLAVGIYNYVGTPTHATYGSGPQCFKSVQVNEKAASVDANIIVNNRKQVTLKPGDIPNYVWWSSGGNAWSSTWSATGSCPYKTNNGSSGTWIANSKNGSHSSTAIVADQVGCSFTITYNVSNGAQTDSDSIVVNVVNTGGLPNLTASFNTPPSGKKVGEPVNLTGKKINDNVQNITVSFANQYSVQYNQSGAYSVVGFESVGGLSKNAQVNYNHTVAFSEEGTHNVRLCVDTGNTVQESNESDNCQVRTITISPADPVSAGPPPPVEDPNQPPPTFTCSPSVINAGDPVEITWSCQDGSSKAFGKGFSTGAGSPPSGNVTIDPGPSSTSIYEVLCENGGAAQCTVNVGSSEVNISVNPKLIRPGDTTEVTWFAQNVISCSLFGPGAPASSQTTASGNPGTLSGAFTSLNINSSTTFTIQCDGTKTDSDTVHVLPIFQEI